MPDQEVKLTWWECLMLAGPLIGQICVWLLGLYMKNADPEPTTRRPLSHIDGPERVPYSSRKRGSTLSDFVKAMREENEAPTRTSTLTPGMPTRMQIHSPRSPIPSPLFPLSAPLTNETCMSPGDAHDSTFSRQINGSMDSSMMKTPPSTTRIASTANPLEEEDNRPDQSAHSPASYAELLNEAGSIPLPQSPPHQPTTLSPSESRRVRFSPHVRVVSTGAQLFPTNQQNPLSPNVDLPTPPIRPAIWEEEDEDGTPWA